MKFMTRCIREKISIYTNYAYFSTTFTDFLYNLVWLKQRLYFAAFHIALPRGYSIALHLLSLDLQVETPCCKHAFSLWIASK